MLVLLLYFIKGIKGLVNSFLHWIATPQLRDSDFILGADLDIQRAAEEEETRSQSDEEEVRSRSLKTHECCVSGYWSVTKLLLFIVYKFVYQIFKEFYCKLIGLLKFTRNKSHEKVLTVDIW